MNKKGFTLIEIIIVITLIVGVGITFSIISIKNLNISNKKRLEKLYSRILEATNVFISNEKDEDGVEYNYAINSGAKGVKIPISYIVSKGYVDKNTVNEVYKLDKLDLSKNYYVLVVNGGEEDNKIKLILDDEVQISLIKKNWRKYNSTNNDKHLHLLTILYNIFSFYLSLYVV